MKDFSQYKLADLLNEFNEEPETIFRFSIFPKNNLCVKIRPIEEDPFEILLFEKKSYKLLRKLKINENYLQDLCPNNNAINITTGKKENELIIFFSNGKIYTTTIVVDLKEDTIHFEETHEVIHLSKYKDIFLNSHLFYPLYYKNSLIGIIISNDISKEFDAYWVFLFEKNKIFEIPINADYIKVFFPEYNGHSLIVAIDRKSIILFQIDTYEDFNLENIVFEIPLDINLCDPIFDISLHFQVLSIWTFNKIYRYSLEYGQKIDCINFNGEIEDIITYSNQKFVLLINNKELFRVDLSTNFTYKPVLLDSDYKPLKTKFNGETKVFNLIDNYVFFIQDNDNYYYFRYFEDRKPVYIINKKKKIKKNFFDLLEGSPVEIQQKYKSILSSRIKMLEIEMQNLTAHSCRIYTPKKYFDKKIDDYILEHLYVDKNFSGIAEAFNMNETSVFIHVKDNFGLPRCQEHRSYNQECSECIQKLTIWKETGYKIIESKVYRKPTINHEIIVSSNKILREFRLSVYKRSLRLGFLFLLDIQKNIEIPEDYFEEVFRIFSSCNKENLLKGRGINDFVAASVILVFHIKKKPIPIDYFVKTLKIKKKRLYNCIKLIRNEILPKLDLIVSNYDPKFYLENFVKNLNLSNDVSNNAEKILEIAKQKSSDIQGKDPRGFAAGAIYIASNILGERKTQQEICNISHISAVTLRKRAKELRRCVGMIVPQKNKKFNSLEKSIIKGNQSLCNNNNLKSRQKHFFFIADKEILDVLSKESLTCKEIHLKLNIKNQYEKAYLENKLNELEKNKEITSFITLEGIKFYRKIR